MKVAWWKAAVIGAVIVWAIVSVWPREGRSFFNLSLGLDLKGGSYLQMRVMTDDAVRAEADVAATRIGERLQRQGFTNVRVTPGQAPGSLVVTGFPPERQREVRAVLDEELNDFSVDEGSGTIELAMSNAALETTRETAVQQALQTIRNRVDAFGVGEVNAQRLGGGQRDRILVELPGVEDPGRVKNLMQTQARLELRLAYYQPGNPALAQGATREDVVAMLGGQVPQGVEVLPTVEKNPQTGEMVATGFLAVEKASVITGSDLQDARPSQDEWGQPSVAFRVRVGAAERFGKFTRANTGRVMPIILDDRIISFPVIRSEISVSGQISGGNFNQEETKDLAISLRAGALPARVTVIEERTVGPSLGADSIRWGLRASIIGAAFTCVFMLVYYSLSGVTAIIALALNMLLLFAGMAQFGAALTLPGIAGLALTIGMAVDANVLIFERMREEMRAGRTIRATVIAGFDKAFSAIFDSNLTTIIAALFLFQYGTGPVQGFAVTLTIGLMANMFTAVFVSRFIFEAVLAARPVKRLYV